MRSAAQPRGVPPTVAVLLGLSLTWILPASGQVHFTDCVDGEGNIHNSTLIVSGDSSPNIDGEPLAFGSEVAVFSAQSGLCTGVTTWNGSNTTITVWGNDDQTTQIEGMIPGEPMDVRVWDASGGTEFSGGRVEVGWQSGPGLNDSGLYQNDALMVITFLSLTDIDPPPVPSLVAPAEGASVGPSPTLDWSPVAGASTFQLQVDDSPDFGSPRIDQTGIVLTASGVANLPVDVTWYWRVRADGEGGFGDWSETRSFNTVTLPDPPGLTWPLNEAQGVSVPTALFWTAVTDVSFRLQVAHTNNFIDPVVDRSGLTSTAISGLGLEYDMTYHWRLRSVGASGSGAWSGSRRFTTESEPPPSAPSLIDPFDGADEIDLRPTLDWSESARASLYRIQVATESEFLNTMLDQFLEPTEVQLQGGLLESASTYWWRVRAVSNRGEGDWSAAFSFTTAAATNRIEEPTDEFPSGAASLIVYPNPVISSAVLELRLGSSTPVDLRVFDMLGREIKSLASGTLQAGRHRFEWRPDGLPPGIYLARLQLPTSSTVRTLILAQ